MNWKDGLISFLELIPKKTIIIIYIYYLTVNHLSLSVIFDFEIFDHYIFNTFIHKSRAILVFLISISESVLE